MRGGVPGLRFAPSGLRRCLRRRCGISRSSSVRAGIELGHQRSINSGRIGEFANKRGPAMPTRAVATHLDDATLARLKQMARIENRSVSQLQRVALKALLDMSPGARRALFAIDGIADADERRFAGKMIGRAALAAYER